jgi:hypothetical protein
LRAIFGPTNENGEWRIKYNMVFVELLAHWGAQLWYGRLSGKIIRGRSWTSRPRVIWVQWQWFRNVGFQRSVYSGHFAGCLTLCARNSVTELNRLAPVNTHIVGFDISYGIFHSPELYTMYALPNIIWMIKWRRLRGAGHVARIGKRIVASMVLVGKHQGRSLERSRRTWKDNI